MKCQIGNCQNDASFQLGQHCMICSPCFDLFQKMSDSVIPDDFNSHHPKAAQRIQMEHQFVKILQPAGFLSKYLHQILK